MLHKRFALVHDADSCVRDSALLIKLFKLAEELAQPVSRGLLSVHDADVALLLRAVRAARTGEIRTDLIDTARFAGHVLRLHVWHEQHANRPHHRVEMEAV